MDIFERGETEFLIKMSGKLATEAADQELDVV